MTTIELRNVAKFYGAVPVLRDISLEVSEGEFVVLVGPSGCGKSTLLRMIAGLEKIGEGQIAIGGRVVNDMPAKDRDIAMVFQNYALYPHMNVADNMSFALRLAGRPKAEIRQRVNEAANVLGLEALLERLPKQLSGGQRQRVAMGRAIVRNPKAFLFDEPLSNLDAKLRVKMRAEIKKLHQRLGRTTVYVTHDQTEAMTMADRIVVMNGGRIEQTGAPLDLYRDPCNVFVAGFIGSPEINLIPARVEHGSAVAAGGLRLPLPAGLPDGRDILYGIRPQHITLADSGVPATLMLVEPTGEDQELVLRAGDTELHAVVRTRSVLAPGRQVQLGWDVDSVLLFDRARGDQIVR